MKKLLRSTAVGALLGTLVGALALAVWDGASVLEQGGGVRTLVATLAAAFLLASAGALVAVVIMLATRGVLVLLERKGLDWGLVLGAVVTSSLSVLGAQAWVLSVLSGAGIRTAVIALSGALGIAVSVALILVLRSVADRAGLHASLRARTAFFIAGCIATVVATIYLAPGLIDELDVESLLVISAPICAGIIVALIGIERNALLYATAGVWLVLGVFALAHAGTDAPAFTRRLVAKKTHAARVVMSMVRSERKLSPMPPGPGTCRPGVKPTVISGKRGTAPDGAPNIVVITSDSVRWDHTSLSGYARDTTPNLKRWAKSAAVFSTAYTPGASTRQTFRALFTGLYPSLVMPSASETWWGVSLARKQASLADRLRQAGYLTASSTVARKGFDPKTGSLKGFDRMLPKISSKGSRGERSASQTRGQLANILRELRAPRTKPLFTWAHLMVTHQNYEIDTTSDYGEDEIDRYDWAIRFVDQQLNELFTELKKDGLWSNTYVIFSADHGQAFYEHGNHLHGMSVYAEETHVPFLIWGPKVQAGVRDEAVSTLDMFPTMLELAGAPKAADVCGQSLLPWLKDSARAPGRPVYMEQIPDERPRFSVGYVRGKYKLVYSPREGLAELYDVKADAAERHDLSRDQAERVTQLLGELVAFQKKHGMSTAAYGLR